MAGSMTHTDCLTGSVSAQSRIVRSGVMTGRPLTVATSSGDRRMDRGTTEAFAPG